jgi:hypothetical protein
MMASKGVVAESEVGDERNDDGPEHEKRRRSTDTSHDGRGRFCACTQRKVKNGTWNPSWTGSSNGPCRQIEAWAPAVIGYDFEVDLHL